MPKVEPDDVVGRLWWHGSSADLEPATVLTAGEPAVHGNENDRVWITDCAWQASKYGAHTYLVEPDGEVSYRNSSNHEFWCDSAAVVRKASVQEILDAANRAWPSPPPAGFGGDAAPGSPSGP